MESEQYDESNLLPGTDMQSGVTSSSEAQTGDSSLNRNKKYSSAVVSGKRKLVDETVCCEEGETSSVEEEAGGILWQAGLGPYECPEIGCEERYFQGSGLVMHLFVAHTVNIFPCATCYEGFTTSESRDEHNCLPPSLYHCPHCSMYYKLKEDLHRHLKRQGCRHFIKGGIISEEAFISSKCNVCGEVFTKGNGGFVGHMKETWHLHCEECGQRFRDLTLFTAHVNLHRGIKPAKPPTCNICARTFKSSRNLEIHYQKKHVDSPQHVCKDCGCGFGEQSLLDYHRQHNHEKPRPSPVTCKRCNKQFVRRDKLVFHTKYRCMHSQGYRCSYCAESYKSLWMLKKHLLKHTLPGRKGSWSGRRGRCGDDHTDDDDCGDETSFVPVGEAVFRSLVGSSSSPLLNVSAVPTTGVTHQQHVKSSSQQRKVVSIPRTREARGGLALTTGGQAVSCKPQAAHGLFSQIKDPHRKVVHIPQSKSASFPQGNVSAEYDVGGQAEKVNQEERSSEVHSGRETCLSKSMDGSDQAGNQTHCQMFSSAQAGTSTKSRVEQDDVRGPSGVPGQGQKSSVLKPAMFSGDAVKSLPLERQADEGDDGSNGDDGSKGGAAEQGNDAVHSGMSFSTSKADRSLENRAGNTESSSCFQCSVCMVLYHGSGAEIRYAKHMILSHGRVERKLFFCKVCHTPFLNARTLQRHTTRYHYAHDSRFSCSVCGLSFEHACHLQTHKLSNRHRINCIRVVEPKSFQCTMCSRCFHSKNQLDEHKSNHFASRRFAEINKERENRSYAEESFHTISGEKEEGIYIQAVGGQSLDTDAILKEVLKGQYSCTVCDQRFASAVKLWLHVKTHDVQVGAQHVREGEQAGKVNQKDRSSEFHDASESVDTPDQVADQTQRHMNRSAVSPTHTGTSCTLIEEEVELTEFRNDHSYARSDSNKVIKLNEKSGSQSPVGTGQEDNTLDSHTKTSDQVLEPDCDVQVEALVSERVGMTATEAVDQSRNQTGKHIKHIFHKETLIKTSGATILELHTHPESHTCQCCSRCHLKTINRGLLQWSTVCMCDQRSMVCDQCGMAFVWGCALLKHQILHHKIKNKRGSYEEWLQTQREARQRELREQLLSASNQGTQAMLITTNKRGSYQEWLQAQLEAKKGDLREQLLSSSNQGTQAMLFIGSSEEPATCQSHQTPPLASSERSARSENMYLSDEDPLEPEDDVEADQPAALFRICKDCHEPAEWSSQLKQHGSTQLFVYRCEDCDAVFQGPGELAVHCVTHATHAFRCRSCRHTFEKAKQLADHYTRCHSFSCPQRQQVFESATRVERERSAGRGNGHKCVQCGQEFSLKTQLAEHYTSKHSFPCQQCGKVFCSDRELVNHCTEHQSLGFQCETCQQVFEQLNDLVQHYFAYHSGPQNTEQEEPQAMDMSENPEQEESETASMSEECSSPATHVYHECPECEESFSLVEELRRHRFESHPDSQSLQRKCHDPQLAFSRASDFKCKLCNKRFSNEADQLKHEAVHGRMPFRCGTCGEEFLNRKSLMSHQHVHSNKRAFRCNVCNATFVTFLRLREHKVFTHITDVSSAPVFSCNVCRVTFDTSVDLSTHMSSKHVISRLVCPQCRGEFPTVLTLQAHLADKHGGNLS